MSEQGRPTAGRDQQIAQRPEDALCRDAPLPPPVGVHRNSSRSSDHGSHAHRQQLLSYRSNYHRHRVRQGRAVWPSLAVLGLAVVGGVASLVVLATEQSSSEPLGTVESAEVAAVDPGASSRVSTPRIDSERADFDTSAALAAPAAESQRDPFERFLELVRAWGITDAPELSRDDARTRAILGCSVQWAPGTVDAALAEAHDEFLQPYRDQGLCG